MPATPFTEPALLRGPLYATADRLARRTSALHAAKTEGSDAAAVIADLTADVAPAAPIVLDIGCGRGTTTLRLAERLGTARVIALDRSPALLAATAQRAAEVGHAIRTVCADLHHLPLPDSTVDIAVAAFCLYHSPHPENAIAEIARCLTPGGRAILTTKSADSYQELDHLIATAGLDTSATATPSLYTTFHSGNLEQVVTRVMRVECVQHEQHVFRFADFDHLAAYLATTPKYQLARDVAGNPARIAAQLWHRLPERPVTATSTVTYAVAARQ